MNFPMFIGPLREFIPKYEQYGHLLQLFKYTLGEHERLFIFSSLWGITPAFESENSYFRSAN